MTHDNEDVHLHRFVTVTDAGRKAGRAFWRGIIIGAALGMIGGAAFGQDRMTLEPGNGSCFAVVVIENSYGNYNAAETLATDHGPVSLYYDTIGGHNVLDDDQVSVIGLPEGVAADPMQLGIPDGEVGRVCLMEWVGG